MSAQVGDLKRKLAAVQRLAAHQEAKLWWEEFASIRDSFRFSSSLFVLYFF